MLPPKAPFDDMAEVKQLWRNRLKTTVRLTFCNCRDSDCVYPVLFSKCHYTKVFLNLKSRQRGIFPACLLYFSKCCLWFCETNVVLMVMFNKAL